MKNINKSIIPWILTVITLTLTIGFATFTSNSTIIVSAKVDPYLEMQIIDVSEYSTVHNGASNYENNTKDEITSGAYLPYSDSEITYKIDLANLGTTESGIYTVTGLPSNLEYSFTNYTEQDKICDQTTPSNCGKLAKKTIYMTIRYKRDQNNNIIGYNSGTTSYPLDLSFDFRGFHNITYSGFSGTYKEYIIHGGDLDITFSTGDIPTTVGLTGGTGNYTSPTLSLTNITSDITVIKKYSITYSGFSGNTSSLPSSIVYSGDTITFTNESGIPTNVTVTNATGSYTSPTLTISNITDNITITAVSGPVKAYLSIENIYNNSTPSEDSTCDNSLLPDDTSDSNLRYVGSKPCNYIYFNNSNWRIIGIFSINGENLIKIVNPTVYSSSTKFNNNNSNGGQKWGSNSLSSDLNSTFYQQLVTNGYSGFVQSVAWNIGAPSSNANKPSAFYTAEIGTKTASTYNIGLLNISDIAYATSGPTNGNRNTCLNANISTWNSNSVGCISSNAIVNDWLYLGQNEWTVDAISNRAQVYRMQNNGIPYQQSLNNTSTSTRTVVYLKENIKFDSGNGSSTLPYRISEIS